MNRQKRLNTNATMTEPIAAESITARSRLAASIPKRTIDGRILAMGGGAPGTWSRDNFPYNNP